MAVGNNDSHAKNIAILNTNDGPRLAPFYDLMNTRVYAGLGAHFAFRIGGEFDPAHMTPSHLRDLAIALGVKPPYMMKIAHETMAQVADAIPAAVAAILPDLGPGERVMAERLQFKILHIVKQMRQRILG